MTKITAGKPAPNATSTQVNLSVAKYSPINLYFDKRLFSHAANIRREGYYHRTENQGIKTDSYVYFFQRDFAAFLAI